MEFLNVGPGELLALALIGLILFGPEDLLRIARTLGDYVRSARQMWQEISSQLEVNLADIDAPTKTVSSKPRKPRPTPDDEQTPQVALPTSPQMGDEPATTETTEPAPDDEVA
ncbi:MAG: twin-arginine translocase TatA/TatE family subunit [Anaerolineales bacterium]